MAYSKKEIKQAKELIIQGMIDGNSVLSIINNNKKIPRIRTIFNWLNPESDYHDKEFLHNYAYASELRAEREFEDILTIADNQEDDVYTNEEGLEITNYNVINRSRLRVDARKWRLGKMQPKKYGDKLDITSKNKRVESSVEVVVRKYSDED
ncbi:MAG: hypothetical protein GY739_15400 [Mesoflavibacter sp.]|nr:hypothetical protein [Mesoflavibacter sp.]